MGKPAKVPRGVGPRYPHVVVLIGATGDLARRKLLPGLFHLSRHGFIPECRIIGVSLDDMDADAFRIVDARSSRGVRDSRSHGGRLGRLRCEPGLRAPECGRRRP
jgi:glucose-6-phosphate 1-dehydrogenase